MRYLRAYEWSAGHNLREGGIQPFVFVNMWEDNPEEQAQRAADELASRRRGERVLMPYWLLSKYIRRHLPELPERGEIDPLQIFEDGVEVKQSIEWLTPLARALRERKITLDLIAADVEDSVETHGMMPPWDREGGAWQREIERIYRSQRAYSRMPPHVRALRPSDFNPWNSRGRKVIHTFNVYAKSLVTGAIREVFIGSRLFHDERGRQPFRISNWNCVLPTFPVIENTWPVAEGAVDTVSSPPLYLNSNWAYLREFAHDPEWCGFVQRLNNARSCAATRGSSVIPWISSPRYFARADGEGYDDGNIWLFGEMIAHLVRTGVREFLFWNWDPEKERSHRILAETLRAHDRPFSQRSLPELPLDIDEVTTRGYTTRYSDYLAAKRSLESGR